MALRLLTVAVLLVTLGATAPAQEASGTAVDAERLGGAVRDYFDRLAVGDARRGRPSVRAGKITARQQGETANLTIDRLVIGGPNGERTEIGPIEVAVAPDGVGRYRVTADPPKRFDVVDGAGREICRVAIGDQTWTGLWSSALAGFIEVGVNVTGIGWRCAGSRNVFAKTFAIEAIMEPAAEGRWRGHVNVGLEGTSVRDFDRPEHRLDLDHLRFTVAYENMDVDHRRDAIAANGSPSWAAALPALAIPLDASDPDSNGELWRYATPATARLEAAGLTLVADAVAARGGFELSLTGYRDRDKTLTFEIVYAQEADISVAGTPTGPGEIWLDLVFAGLALDSLSPPKLSRKLDDPARLLATAREIIIRSVVASTTHGEIRGSGTLRPAPGGFPPVQGELTLETEDLAGQILEILSRFGGPANQAFADAVRATVTALAGGDRRSERFEIRIDPNGGFSVNGVKFEEIVALFQANLGRR